MISGGIEKVVSVSTTLLNPTEKLKIQLSVGFNDNEYKNLISVYETKKATYITINPNIVVAIKYVMQNKEWERTDAIYINERNIYALNAGLSNFYKKLLREDLFIYNTKGYAVEIMSKGNDIEVIPLTKGQVMQLEPAIVHDKQGNTLPGVMVRINKTANEVDLSIDEFEAMINIFRDIRIRQEGMTLLQLYMSMRKQPMEIDLRLTKQQSSHPSYSTNRKSIFDRSDSSSKEFVKSPVSNIPEVFMNLPENIET